MQIEIRGILCYSRLSLESELASTLNIPMLAGIPLGQFAHCSNPVFNSGIL